jgi:hypothetical protein
MVFMLPDGRMMKRPALLPYDPAEPYSGWSPKAYRAACAQLLESPLVRRWLEENDAGDVPQRFLSEVLEDRFFLGEVRANEKAYKMTPEFQAYLRGVSAHALHAVFGTDFGARRGPDEARYQHLLEKVEWLEMKRWSLKDRRIQLRSRLRAGHIGDSAFLADVDEIEEAMGEVAAELDMTHRELDRIVAGERTRPYADDAIIPTTAELMTRRREMEARLRTAPEMRKAQADDTPSLRRAA